MPVTVIIHRAMRMRSFILSNVACLALAYFFTLSYKGRIFGKKKLSSVTRCFDLFYKFFCGIYLILRRIQPYVSIKLHTFSCKIFFVLVTFSWKLNIFYRFSKNNQIQTFMKIRALGTEMFHANRWTDGQTDMEKQMIAFRSFANAPKTIYRFLGYTKINDELGRLLREETILWYHCWCFMEAFREKWVTSKIISYFQNRKRNCWIAKHDIRQREKVTFISSNSFDQYYALNILLPYKPKFTNKRIIFLIWESILLLQ